MILHCSLLKFLRIENRKKITKFLVKKVKKWVKSQKGCTFNAGYTYNAFWEGGGGGVSALLEPLFFKKFPHNPLQKIPPVSLI